MTHPFHPLFGKTFELLTYRRAWGEDRVFFYERDQLRRLPANWTDAAPPSAFVQFAAGRAHFRLDDLLRLFDARDTVQVKYEMVRRVEAEGASVTDAATAFGFSRPSFYEAQASLRAHGLAGLLPKKRGPRGGHKLSDAVVTFIEETRAQDPTLGSKELVHQVKTRFGIRVHPRSVERALARRKKKRP